MLTFPLTDEQSDIVIRSLISPTSKGWTLDRMIKVLSVYKNIDGDDVDLSFYITEIDIRSWWAKFFISKPLHCYSVIIVKCSGSGKCRWVGHVKSPLVTSIIKDMASSYQALLKNTFESDLNNALNAIK